MASDPKDPTTVESENQPVVDRVVEVSKYPDGSAAQMDGYEVIDVEEEVAAEEGAPQVSGAAVSRAELVGGTTRRSRKRNTEEAVNR